MIRRKMVIANWKTNPDSPGRAVALARKIDRAVKSSKNVEVVIAPPFPFLSHVGRVIRHSKLGAQDTFWEDTGPYTGEVSWHQLKHLGVSYVIVGHSERRRLLGETDLMVNRKVLAALQAGFKVVLCVGEPKRESGIRNYELRKAKHYVKSQLAKDLKGVQNIHNSRFMIHNSLVVCYEPVWAISTARSTRGQNNADTPENAAEMIRFMRTFLDSRFKIHDSRVIYGGSVNPQNAFGFLSRPEIDGALVGGASLHAAQFGKIIRIAANL